MTNTANNLPLPRPGWRARQVWAGGGGQYVEEACGPSLAPPMPMLGWSCWDAAQVQGLDAHCHPTHEICLIADGQVTWWAEDADGGRETVSLRRGDGFVTAPNEPHGGVDTLMHPCELFWLHVDLPRLRHGLSDAAGGALDVAFGCKTPRHFRASPCVRAAFEILVAEHRAPSVLRQISAHGALLNLLVAVARDRAQAPSPAPLSPPIQVALCWMRERLGESFCVQSAAAQAGMTAPRFHERFLAEVGLAPGEWRMRERIARAEERLRSSRESVTQVALDLGFGSSQHFATAFKRYTGQTPTAFRARFDTAPPR